MPTRTQLDALLAGAHLNLALQNPGSALEQMTILVGRLRPIGVLFRLPEALWLQGKAWAALGERERAQQALVEAQAVAQATKARRMLWKILASLAEIEEMQGNLSSAQEYRRRARLSTILPATPDVSGYAAPF